MNSDKDSVLRECERSLGENLGKRIMRGENNSDAQTSEGNRTGMESRSKGEAENTASGGGRNTENNVVSVLKRVLTEAEVALLSKGPKFCPTPEKVGIF